MTTRIYVYEKCSTCRNALKFLNERHITSEVCSIIERPPGQVELKRMLGFVGGDLRRLFNTSGQVYRELQLGVKLPKMTEAEALKLLASNGKLIKRPFLLSQDAGLVGFREDEWRKFFS